MRWPVVKTIWFREIRDQLRDRRTLFMLLVVPLLLYPGLGMAAMQLAVLFSEQPLAVGMVGLEYLDKSDAREAQPNNPLFLPVLPPLVDRQDRLFAESLFRGEDLKRRHLLQIVTGDQAEMEEKLRREEIQAYLVFTPRFVTRLKQGQQVALNLHLVAGQPDPPLVPEPADKPRSQPEASPLGADDDRGQLVYDRLRPVLREWGRQIVEARLKRLGAPLHFQQPLLVPMVQPKTEEVWARLFPFLIVMMSLTGALYPAIDVCAGEKERGTMETLLISPASRAEIVWGKFLTVWLFSAVTALLNLASLGFTAWQFSEVVRKSSPLPAAGGDFALPLPGLAALAWCVVLLIPLAAFFSAVCLALAVYARSSKEGQYYLMPLLVLTIPLVVLSLLPGAELSPVYSMLPITGPALLLQELINARTAEDVPWLYLAPVLIPLAAYCYLALHWAIQQFNREEVLFREAERISLRVWFHRLFREKEPLPSAGQAMFCFVAIMFLRWVFGAGAGRDLLTATAMQLLVFVATPALLMAVMLTARPLWTLRLRIPWTREFPDSKAGLALVFTAPNRLERLLVWLVLGLTLAMALHGPMVALLEWVISRFPDVTEHLKHLQKAIEELLGQQTPLAVQLLVIAVLPAVCEELAFRGFILSGLARRLGKGKAILVSALLFAFAHMDAFRFLSTFGLGLILGLLAIKSGSLFPGMVFHGVNNALVVLAGHVSLNKDQELIPAWLYSNEGLYHPIVSVSGAALAALLLFFVIRLPSPRLVPAPPETAGGVP